MSRIFTWQLILLFLCIAEEGRSGIELVVRETFEGVRELNSENPGNLGSWVAGSWSCRPVGPRLPSVAEPGWSGDAQGTGVRTYWNLHQPLYEVAREAGMIGAWVRFESLGTAGYFGGATNSNPAMVLMLTSGQDNAPCQMIGVTGAGQWVSRNVDGQWQLSGAVREKTWYWVQLEWENPISGLFAKASCQPLGGDPVELGMVTIQSSGYQINEAHLMNGPFQKAPNQDYTWRGRLGGATLARIGFIGEGAPLTDLLPPTEKRHVWHLNPVTGNDTNDGLSPDRAWKTVSKLNRESAHSGLLSPAAGGYDLGDRLIIDTSVSHLDLGSGQLQFRTPGLTVCPPEGQSRIRILAHKDVSAPATIWVQADPQNYPRVWTTTDQDASDLADVVVWENDLWLSHPTGASVASVLDVLNATPGSFYSDGVRLYLHPFSSSNPNTDGKTYARSRFREGGASAVMLFARDMHVKGLDVRKTCLARSSDSDSYNAYGIQGEGAFGGTSLLEDCYTDYVGKHGIGFTDSGSNRDLTLVRCQVEQGSPYFNQTPFVDYNGNSSAAGNRTTYVNCKNLKVSGKIGSRDGQSSLLQSYYLHNNGVGVQFDHIHFQNCVLGGQITVSSGVRTLTIDQTAFGGGETYAQETLLTRCVVDQLPVGAGLPVGRLIARNNLFVFSQGVFNGSYNASIQGNVTYEGNTFDLRPYLRTDNAQFALFDRIGPLDITFRNNIFVSPTDRAFTVIENAQDSDVFKFSRNLYQISPTQSLISRFFSGNTTRNLSLAEWQALGQDLDSQSGDPQWNEFYMPLPQSPAAFSGMDLGALSDFSGRTFPRRSSMGALEPADTYQNWLPRYLNPDQMADASVSGPAADPDGDGLPNALEFGVNGDPTSPTPNGMATQFSADRLFASYEQSSFSRGVALKPETSADLIIWRAVPEMAIGSESGLFWGGVVKKSFSRAFPISRSRLFWRLSATLDPGQP